MVAHPATTLVNEASRYSRSRSPNVAATRPSASTTAAAAFGTSQVATWSSAAMLGPAGRSGFAVDELGEAEREIEALTPVQPRVADRLVAVVEIVVGDRVGAAEALGDVVA